MGAGSGGARGAQAPPVSWTGGGGGGGGHRGHQEMVYQHLQVINYCDIMNIESSKIMLSEVRQLLHITCNSSYVCHCSTERTFSAID